MAGLAIPDLEGAIRSMIERDQVTIPPYPGVAMRLQQLVAAGNYGMNDLAKVAMTDPVVTGYLLRSANSAAYRGASQITSVADAVTRIGGADVVRIAIAASLGAQAGRKGVLAAMRRRIWQESLTSAVICFQLASARRLNGQEAFVCGLLHDIGKVVATSSIEALLAYHKDTRSLDEAEWMHFIDRFHVDFGKLTARKWALSEIIQAAIAQHHEPEVNSLWKPMVDIVRTSDAAMVLIHAQAAISLPQLEALPGLSPAEAAHLYNAIPAIGPFVASMDDAAPSAGASAAASPSQVTAHARSADHSGDVQFPGTVLRGSTQLKVECQRVSVNTVTFLGADRHQQKYLVRLQLHPPGAPFEVHATVESCEPHPGGYLTVARLFALAGAAKDRWAAMLVDVGVAETPAGASPAAR